MEDNAKEEYIEYAKALLLWGQIKTEYEKGNIVISVAIQLAQKFFINTSSLALLCSLAITIIFPIITIVFLNFFKKLKICHDCQILFFLL